MLVLVANQPMSDNTDKFFNAVAAALADKTFAQLILSRPLHAEAKRVKVRLVKTVRGDCLCLLHEEHPSHRTETMPVDKGLTRLRELTGASYRDAHLFTEKYSQQLRFSRKGKAHLARAKQNSVLPPPEHDHRKNRLIPPGTLFLRGLQLTDDEGRVKASKQAKYRQICHFAQLAEPALKSLQPRNNDILRIVDMGCGKGYLTFTLHSLVTERLGMNVETTGIDRREDLVTAANLCAKESSLRDISFISGEINDYAAEGADVLAALHACDTATDDALAAGIRNGVSLIMVAPCCHRDLRTQTKTPAQALAGVVRHTILFERAAAVFSDALRCLVLECHGYTVQAVEFVDPEHTPRNTLILAERNEKNPRLEAADELAELKSLLGLKQPSALEAALA